MRHDSLKRGMGLITEVYRITLTDSIENSTPTKSIQLRNSKSSLQIQIKPKFEFEIVPWDTEDSEFLDLVNFGDVAF